jgi:hypothetical protein
MESTTGWPMPAIQTPLPERQAILNQLPAHALPGTKPFIQQPQQAGARAWLPAYEAHWDHSLEKLRQLISETKGEEAR